MTNFERIKEDLKPEQVAFYYQTKVRCDFCPCGRTCRVGLENRIQDCAKNLMNWLGSEVND